MNFRLRLQIFFVLLSIVSSHASDPMVERRRADFLSVVNNLRRDIANDLKIQYMHELVYDDTLYQRYDIKFKGFASWFTYHSYEELIQLSRAPHDTLKSIAIVAINLSRNMTYYGIEGTENILQLLSPLQKRIRCSKLKDGGVKCVLGPMKEPIWWYNTPGVPGSLCDDGYYNYDGLCSMLPVTTTKVLSTTTAQKPYSNEQEAEEECECSGSIRLQTFLGILTVIVTYLF